MATKDQIQQMLTLMQQHMGQLQTLQTETPNWEMLLPITHYLLNDRKPNHLSAP